MNRDYQHSSGSSGLFFTCCGMTNLLVSQSDPMVVVYQKEKDATLSEVFRSEVVLNSLAPTWIKKFTVAYHFETVQTLV